MIAMRVAILGAGGVGGYYGGLLASSGQDVILIARGKHLAAIQECCPCMESVHGDLRIQPAQATDDPAQVGPVDLVLVAVKSYDLDAAAEVSRALVGPETSVLPLLDGLDAAERLAAVLGTERILIGFTHISSSVVAPGVIRQVSPVQRITFGEQDGSITSRTERIRDVLAASGVEVVLTRTPRVALWEKFVFIASISGVCCIGAPAARSGAGHARGSRTICGRPARGGSSGAGTGDCPPSRHRQANPAADGGICARNKAFDACRPGSRASSRAGSDEWHRETIWPGKRNPDPSSPRDLWRAQAQCRIESQLELKGRRTQKGKKEPCLGRQGREPDRQKRQRER